MYFLIKLLMENHNAFLFEISEHLQSVNSECRSLYSINIKPPLRHRSTVILLLLLCVNLWENEKVLQDFSFSRCFSD